MGVRNVSRVFWLGVIGLIFGIIGAVFAIIVQSIGEAFGAAGPNLYYNAAGAIIFSIVGMAGAVLEERRILGGLLMIVGAVGVLISISAFGVVALILFLIGGVLILVRKRAEPVVMPPSEPLHSPPSSEQISCLNCGVYNPPNAKFCATCGAALIGSTARLPPSGPSPPPSPPTGQPPSIPPLKKRLTGYYMPILIVLVVALAALLAATAIPPLLNNNQNSQSSSSNLAPGAASPTPLPQERPVSTPAPTPNPLTADYSSYFNSKFQNAYFSVSQRFLKSTNERGNDVYTGKTKSLSVGTEMLTTVELANSEPQAKQLYGQAVAQFQSQGFMLRSDWVAQMRSRSPSLVGDWEGQKSITGTVSNVCSVQYYYEPSISSWLVITEV